MARLSIGRAVRIENEHPTGGLEVVFDGIEVLDVRTRSLLGWRKALVALGLAGLALGTVGAWTRVAPTEMTPAHVWQSAGFTALLGLYGLWAVRRVGVVWRFDHRRKKVLRRHWLRGMGRSWSARKVQGVALRRTRRLGGEVYELDLVGPSGRPVTRVGTWEKGEVDVPQVEAVVGEIRKVMAW